MARKMMISKKAFITNLSEFCWAGNGRVDLKDGDEANIYEPVCDTYTRWIAEWVQRFNALNKGFTLDFRVINDGFSDSDGYYCIYRVEPKRLTFPHLTDDDEEETYMLTVTKENPAGEISCESADTDSDDEDGDDGERGVCVQCHDSYPFEHFPTHGKCLECFNGPEGEAEGDE